MDQIKKMIKQIPIIGDMVGRGAQTLRLRKDMQETKNCLISQEELLHKLHKKLESIEHETSNKHKESLKKYTELTEGYSILSDKVEDFIHSTKMHRSLGSPKDSNLGLFADNHALDRFYVNFENTFRGDEKLIYDRLIVYLKRFTDVKLDFGKFPAIDIGCGRGEMLSLLSKNGINAMGIDLNEKMVERANEKGLNAVQANAIDYIKSLKTSSVSAVTGFHIIEHIPFEHIVELFSECYRVLKKGGFIIFETPNPENIDVATVNFYLDPSHLKPLPPSLTEFLASNLGYNNIEILRIRPPVFSEEDNKKVAGDHLYQHIRSRFIAPQDYAIIAYK